jgi:copper chaperone CopZ
VSGVTANPETHLLVITFDDARTSVDKIVQTLKANDYPPEGEPKDVSRK